MRTYKKNLETGKIEFRFEKSDYLSMSEEDRREIKSNFLFSNYGKCWVSRAKNNTWSAENVCKKLGAEFSLQPPKVTKEKSRDVRRVEEELSDLLMAEVEVRIKKQVKRHGKRDDVGEVTIQFGSLDELNGLIDKLRAAAGG